MLIILLPGMDGTGQLFGAFLKCLPTDTQTKIVTYPDRIYLSYEQLEKLVFPQLPVTGKYIIIAESFSGPIALRLASRAPGDLAAVILVSSFAYRPLSWMGFILGALPLNLILRVPLPDFMLKAFLLGKSASAGEVAQVRKAIRQVPSQVLAGRLKEALTGDYGKHRLNDAVPVVAIFAKNDHLLGKGSRRSIQDVAPKAEIESVPGRHLALQTVPDAVLRIVQKRGLL